MALGEAVRVSAALGPALAGGLRAEIVDGLAQAGTLAEALARLCDMMRGHTWGRGSDRLHLDASIRALDARSRDEGFHVLHDWDGKADRVNEDIIPVDVLRYLWTKRGAEPADRGAIAILLDYYFVHLLSLLAVRAWDAESADEQIDAVNALLRDLQGPQGSGQKFADDAETLILIATSHYERDERGFDRLLQRVRTLDARHRVNIALGHAASLGCHLRFGFEEQCARDMVALRDDNVSDYPWLCFSLAHVADEYARLSEAGAPPDARRRLAEAMLNGLTPDSRAFVGEPARSLAGCAPERERFRARFAECRGELMAEFERFRPAPEAYSPLAFYFNFAHNVLKGTVIDALVWGDPWRLGFNDLLRGSEPADAAAKLKLAHTLMGYARSSPDRIRGRLMPVIVYDPPLGRQAFSVTMRKLAAGAD